MELSLLWSAAMSAADHVITRRLPRDTTWDPVRLTHDIVTQDHTERATTQYPGRGHTKARIAHKLSIDHGTHDSRSSHRPPARLQQCRWRLVRLAYAACNFP